MLWYIHAAYFLVFKLSYYFRLFILRWYWIMFMHLLYRSVRFTQQLVLFAPQAVSVHSHLQTLLPNLSSRQVASGNIKWFKWFISLLWFLNKRSTFPTHSQHFDILLFLLCATWLKRIRYENSLILSYFIIFMIMLFAFKADTPRQYSLFVCVHFDV